MGQQYKVQSTSNRKWQASENSIFQLEGDDRVIKEE